MNSEGKIYSAPRRDKEEEEEEEEGDATRSGKGEVERLVVVDNVCLVELRVGVGVCSLRWPRLDKQRRTRFTDDSRRVNNMPPHHPPY